MHSDEQAIRDLIAEWLRTTVAGDAEAQRPLMSEDIVFLQPGRPPMRGREVFLRAFKSGLGQVKLEPKSEIEEIRIVGEMAWVWNKLEVRATPANGGTPLRLKGNTLSILQKQNGRWVMVRDANMLVPENTGPR